MKNPKTTENWPERQSRRLHKKAARLRDQGRFFPHYLWLVLIASIFVLTGFASSRKEKKITEPYQLLSAEELAKLRVGEKCTFVHFWATWCSICLEELPKLMEVLPSFPVVPVIVDLSDPFVQDNFSKKWISQLKPKFTTYLKPESPNEKFMTKAGFKWTKTLPYTYLFRSGKQLKEWDGYIDMGKLKKEVTDLCAK